MSALTTLDAICDLFIVNSDSILTYLKLNDITMNSATKVIESFDKRVNGFEYNPKNFLDSIESEMAICASDLNSEIIENAVEEMKTEAINEFERELKKAMKGWKF